MNKRTNNKKHWVYRDENRSKLWLILIGLMFVAILPEFFIHHHAYFEAQGINADAKPGFYPWYGVATCAVMIIAARLLGVVLKRKDDYYDDE